MRGYAGGSSTNYGVYGSILTNSTGYAVYASFFSVGNHANSIYKQMGTGGSSTNEIDSFNVTLDARATTDEESYSLIRTAQGILEAQGSNQFGAIRNVSINSLARWGSDPVRPDLKLSTLTVIVTAHREEIAINES